jgi:hypothetical protein
MAQLMELVTETHTTKTTQEDAILATSLSWRMMEDQKSTSASIVQLMVK